MIAKPERRARRARRIALQEARGAGCICRPEVVMRGAGGASDAWSALVFHDAWCPCIRATDGNGTPVVNVVLYRDDDGEAR